MSGSAFNLIAAVGILLCVATALGQAVARLAGATEWRWTAPSIGLAALLALVPPLVRVPGHALAAAVLAAVFALVAGWWERKSLLVPLRSPWCWLLVLVTGAWLTIPFVVNGRFGLLGTSFDDDPRFHFLAVEVLRAGGDPASVGFGGYPLGPHAILAALTRATSIGLPTGLDAELALGPLVAGLAGFGALRDASGARRALCGLSVAIPYLVASYYMQAAFKETLLAALVLAFVLEIRELCDAGADTVRSGLGVGVLAGGAIATYSYPALLWIVGLGAAVLVGEALARSGWRRPLALAPALRATTAPALGACVVMLAVALPQALQLLHFFNEVSVSPSSSGTITKTNVGNLVSQLSIFEVFSLWPIDDFRFQPHGLLRSAMTLLGLGVTTYGALWWLRRRDFALPAAAAGALFIFLVVRGRESPYISAKTLVIAAPLVALLGTAAITALDARRLAIRAPVALVAAAFVVGFGYSSYLTLRSAQVGPPDHEAELRSLVPIVRGSRVLYLGHDDYAGWRLWGAMVTNPPVQAPIAFGQRRQKAYQYGDPEDFDAVDAATYDRYRYVLISNSDYSGSPPPNLRLIRRTRSFRLFERFGTTPAHKLIEAGPHPGAVLDCRRARYRRLVRQQGVAVVAPAPVAVPGPPGGGVGAGYSIQIALPLRAGRWQLSLQYASPQELDVTGPGMRATLPANLDPLGSYWAAGTLVVPRQETVRVTVHMRRASVLFSRQQFAVIPSAVAVSTQPPRQIPLRRACGRWVDWYSTGRIAS
jgi:hypothetical protein